MTLQEKIAEVLWNERERQDPSGPRDERSSGMDPNMPPPQLPILWDEAVERDLWPSSRRDVLGEAGVVLAVVREHLLSDKANVRDEGAGW